MDWSRRLAATTVLVSCLAVAALGDPAQARTAVDVQQKVGSWDEAAARLGLAGSLWEPIRTAGLAQAGRIAVIGGNLTFSGGTVATGDTYASGTYGGGQGRIHVQEKWANTGWAVEPSHAPTMAKVQTITVPVGVPGTRIGIRADVFANCFPQPAGKPPRQVPKRFRCKRSDVLTTGGVLTMTVQPASQMSAPGATTIEIATSGLTFHQLLSIASSLQQVAGSAAAGAGSAQMLGMCGQMVAGKQSAEAAHEFAVAYGYTTRVGSIDGVGMAVTADYRPDRFTLSLVTGAVSSCTYG